MTEEAEVEAAPPGDDEQDSRDNKTSDVNPDENEDDGSESTSGSSGSESSENEDADEEGDGEGEKGPDGLSEYERMRQERIARNQAKLASLGLSEGNNIPRKKKTQKKPKKKQIDLPTRELPSRAGRATFEGLVKQKKEKEEEKNPDACFTCQVVGGELMCCDYCRTLYHPKCHPEPSSADSIEGFRCKQCQISGRQRRVKCGYCTGCKRENNCETCVICVNNRNDGKYKAKCIFRRCQNWGKGVYKEESDEDEGSDNHDSACHACGDGGDVICCDNCTKVFHSNCHKPKIYSLPEGRWTCMYCTKKPVREKKSYKPKYGELLIADMGHKELGVKVNWPVLSCNVCAEKDTFGPKINQEWTTCRACGDSYHLKCLDPPLEKRPGSWRCTTCKEKNKAPRENRLKTTFQTYAKPKNEKLFEGVHDDDCYMCFNGGDLICCDYCSKVFHMKCHIPPLVEIPKGRWKCCECAAVEYKRMMRCGECEACLRDDCGKCAFCLDKPKFGGNGKLKQTCQLKKCNYMRLAPPASRKSISDKDIKNQFKSAKPHKDERNSLQRKQNEPSSSSPREDYSHTQKTKRFKKSSISMTEKSPIKMPPVKLLTSLGTVDISLADDPVGSKIRTIVATAIKKIDKPQVQVHACQYLQVFITNSKTADASIKLGVLMMLVKAMYHHTNDITVQIEAMKTLTKLVVKNKSLGEDIINSGCLALALECVANHKSMLEGHQAVCALLRGLSYDFRLHQLIMSCKAVEAVALALKTNANRLDSLLDGCYFLQNLLCNTCASNDASILFLDLGLTIVIVTGITAFPHAPYLRTACAILTNLAIRSVSRNGAEVDRQCIEKVLSIFEFEVDIDTKKLALDTLKALSVGKDRFLAEFVNYDGIKKVLHLMKAAPHDALVSKNGLMLMTTLVKSRQYAKLFVDSDGFNVTIEQMSVNQNAVFVQTAGCRILRRLQNVPDLEGNRADETIHMILSAIDRFDDEKIQFDGRHALLNVICQCPSAAPLLLANDIRDVNNKYLGEEEGVDATDTSEVVESNPMEEDIKDYTSDAKHDPVCQKIKAIVSKASNHLDDNKAQDKACEHLRKLVKEEKENVIRVLQMGGIEMIVNAMKSHPDKSIVQSEACATLSHIARVYPKSSEAIVKAGSGCLPLVVQALKNHPNHNKVNKFGCSVFENLSYENENHYYINSVNGFETMLDSLLNNSNKLAIVKEVSYFIQNMLSNTSFPPEHISMIASKDIVPILIDAIRSGSKDTDLLEGACGAIKNLALKAEARSIIGKYEASVETVISVIISDVEESVTKNALDALQLMAKSKDIRAQIKQDSNIESLITILSEKVDDVDVAETSIGLLFEFAQVNETINQDVFELVTSGMSKHPDSSSIQKAGCRILGNISLKDDEEAKHAADLILATSMKNHPDDNEVQTSGLCALLNICSEHSVVASILKNEHHLALLSAAELKKSDN